MFSCSLYVCTFHCILLLSFLYVVCTLVLCTCTYFILLMRSHQVELNSSSTTSMLLDCDSGSRMILTTTLTTEKNKTTGRYSSFSFKGKVRRNK